MENTACSNYWSHKDEKDDQRALCSGCDPIMGKKWHGNFPQHQASGYLIGADGFLYHPVDAERVTHTKIVGKVPGELVTLPEENQESPVWEGEVGDE